jgi:hypothetical protein
MNQQASLHVKMLYRPTAHVYQSVLEPTQSALLGVAIRYTSQSGSDGVRLLLGAWSARDMFWCHCD